MRLPSPIENFISKLSELPSLGPRQATRLAFHLLRTGENNIKDLAEAVFGMKKIKTCRRCFFIHINENGICDLCKDPRRSTSIFMIVEKETDLLSIENTSKFSGKYLVLGEISKTGIMEEWQKLRIQNLKLIIEKELLGKADEIIIAFNPTSTGDFNATFVAKELSTLTKKISRLGRGLPTGGEIEFADDETLGSALERRS